MTDSAKDEVFDRSALDAEITANAFEPFVKRAQGALNPDEWTVFAAMVAGAQNGDEIDLTELVSKSGGDKIRYATQTLLSAVVPQLSLDLDGLLSLIAVTTDRGRGTGTPYYMINAFSEWCDQDEARVDSALAAVREGTAPADLLIATLSAGLRVSQRRFVTLLSDMLVGPSDTEANAAAFCLGNMKPSAPGTDTFAIDALRRALDTSGEERSAANLGALLTLSATVGDWATTLSAVRSLVGKSDPGLRLAAARALFPNTVAELDAELVDALCLLLRETRPDEPETIEAIDHALYGMIDGGRRGEALALSKDLLRDGTVSLGDLDSTAHKLRSETPLALDMIAADWLAGGNSELTEAVTDLITAETRDPLTLNPDFAPFALTGAQSAAIARRVVASLILYPVAAIAILLALAKTGPKSAMGRIENIIFDPLLISYWEGPGKYLEERSPSEPAPIQEMIARLLEHLREYIAAIEAAGFIAEMRPSERHRFIAAVKRQEEQRAITDGARKGSLASLFPVSILLYGDSVVSEVFSGDGTSARNEFRMGTVEYSQEIPRLDRIDPVGFWLQRTMFSMGKPR